MSRYICILILCLLGHLTYAQTENLVKKRAKLDKEIIQGDTLSNSVVVKQDLLSKKETSLILKKSKPHSPALAWKLSLMLPGLGQIYNGQWWKVPILYGGIAGTLYGMNWNATKYNEYKDAFSDYVGYLNQDVADGASRVKVNNERWKDVFLADVTTFSESQETWFQATLKNKKDSFKRDRDLTIILMAGIYAINILDALVSAHFYDFDISDDLSMGLRPAVNYTPSSGGSVGFACTIRF